MILRGTSFQQINAPPPPAAPPPAPPPAFAKIRGGLAALRVPDKARPQARQMARLAWQALTAPGGALAAMMVIWCAAFFVLGALVVTLAFDEVRVDALLRPPAPSAPPGLLTPLVHVSIEPLVHEPLVLKPLAREPLASETPTLTRATPRPASRPPLVVPTPSALTK